MGTVSSSAALLGFEGNEFHLQSYISYKIFLIYILFRVDKLLPQKQSAEDAQRNDINNLTRDPSLSTILEERTSQMETPFINNKSIEEDVKGEISLSIDGKDVSVSLYETPDLTENDAKQIIEMFAEQYSEYISGIYTKRFITCHV